jgi:hypothetical protein
VKIEHRYHVRIDTVDKRVVCIEFERIDFLQLVHTRDTGRRRAGSGGALGTSLFTAQISQTIGRCVIVEAVCVEVAHVAPPLSTESSSDTVSTIGSVGVAAAELSDSAAGGSSVTSLDRHF